MSTVEVAAIQIFDGRFELLCLDDPPTTGMRSDCITGMNRPQLEQVIARLLPDLALEDGLNRALGGAITVHLDSWLDAKRTLYPAR